MSRKNMGCCGDTIRFFLNVVNFLFFIMGLVVFITAALLYWTDILGKDLDIKELKNVVEIAQIDTVAIVLMVIGGFAMLVSVIGLLGACCMNRFFLIVYEIVVLCMFLAHGITLLVVVFSSDSIKNAFEKGLDKTVTSLNKNETNFELKCDALLALSKAFKCCGSFNGTKDFKDPSYALKCCETNQKNETATEGCPKKSVNELMDKSVNYIIIPSGFILTVELFAIIAVPIIIKKRNN